MYEIRGCSRKEQYSTLMCGGNFSDYKNTCHCRREKILKSSYVAFERILSTQFLQRYNFGAVTEACF